MKKPTCFSKKDWRKWKTKNSECHPLEKSTNACFDCTKEFHEEMFKSGVCKVSEVRDRAKRLVVLPSLAAI